MSNIKKETISGAKWGMLQKLTMQPLQLVYGMVLARLISPEEMGILGLTAIFFAVANRRKRAFAARLLKPLLTKLLYVKNIGTAKPVRKKRNSF
jgi:hypothetical protein